MKIGILHLSDLHIEKDNYLYKVDLIANSCDYEIKQISNLFIVISGDITRSGRKAEFDNVKLFLTALKEKIKPQKSILPINLVLVPGNHDCCYDDVKGTRKEILKCCHVDVLTEPDFYEDALVVQNNYWDFYNEMLENIPDDKVSFKKEFTPLINFKIVFHCYNSSWMSDINETYGGIVIPENKFLSNDNEELTIALFHHPLNWLSPRTKNNNKSRFEEHLINTSNIVLFGHEHDKGQSKNIFQKGNNVIFSGGKAFQKEEQKETGFGYIEIDLKNKKTRFKVHSWSSNEFIVEYEEAYELTQKVTRKFILNKDFENKLDTLKIPLKHSRKEKLLLSDIFVFPDLEPIEDKEVVQYPNSEELLYSVKSETILKTIIEGEDQSGKTTLFFVLYKKLYEAGYLPIYIRGKNLNNTDAKDIVKKAMKEQYDSNDTELFFQQPKRVLFLDNLQTVSLNTKYKAILLENLSSHFDYIFISVNNSLGSNIATEETTTLKDFNKYKLLPLGHEKRSEIIEQWFRIGENVMTIREDELLKNIQARLDEINSLLGDRLMPSYPIFILTLLQGLDAQILPHDYSQTSYAHCYQALITAGLVREGLKDELSSYFNILKELAFFLFDKKEDTFSPLDFEDFYVIYKKSFYTNHSFDKVLRLLSNANIIKFDDEYYSFSYKYIYYYLVAQKISANIDKHKVLIEELCDNIHVEKNANILIFLSHHSKAQLLIDSIIFTSELPFEDAKPITLDRADPFTEFIAEFVKGIQHDVIEERDPKQEVKKGLKRKDDQERKSNHKHHSEDLMPPEFREISQAFRTIRILGQIVKNQKGDFEKGKLEELVESAYRTGFRLVGFFADLIEKDKQLFIEAISEKLNKKSNVDIKEIEKTVLSFLQYISWRICMDSFTNLMFAVGTKGSDELFEAVSRRIDSSAAKIVTFAIKSYYGSINTNDLKQLFKDVENNYLAQSILRVYVRKHLYTNFVEKSKKDQIIRIAGFKPNAIMARKKLNP
ncbi:hypothetical protein AQPE_3964 [Aquipluma nitroreducens]|uniref:Uncharacterized protein n=1 Tax=Aquipluma nitroreducens TaxID=2010828 RepID=A0A5K7SE84_9BACT|nr:metallophosphoesterase [Aquipluma nitroreducens]BBE19776.1 hypothetical protein AQPE_3964 [Aquipluma nitroreducens]